MTRGATGAFHPLSITREKGNPMRACEWGLLVGLSMLWGSAFFFTAIAIHELPTFLIVFLRVTLAAALLWLALSMMGLRLPREAEAWRSFFVLGLLTNVLPFCLVAWGQLRVASSVASILNAAAPFATLLLGHFWTGEERLSAHKVLGLVVGTTGIVVLLSGGWHVGVSLADALAYLACLGAAICYALAAVVGRFRRFGEPPIVRAAGQLVAASVLLLPAVVISDNPFGLRLPSWSVVGSVLALAVLSTALAYIVYFKLLRTAGATNLLLVTFLVPISAMFFGIVLLGDSIGARETCGLILVGVGLLAIDGRVFCFLVGK
ncbi:Threonine/homoserine efflux transporter RhtA [Filomicrobium insigne]|uniref:Threonine/homoserine efflux transporter RhtA n=1 Tax=Filomicrobium insigne TaxID=418854 RepID=A0A1H0T0A1_9HYPH|nr:DMT family transporter [Filomicrobium insigne]SDP46928.1 Threonine/homoserine efflux transporter RhtA [Filomicrobium insigne]